MRRFPILILILFLISGCGKNDEPKMTATPEPTPISTPQMKPTPTPKPTSTPVIEGEIEVVLECVWTGRMIEGDNQYLVTVGYKRMKSGNFVKLKDCVGSEYASLKVNYHSAYRDEWDTWIIEDYEMEILDNTVPGLPSVWETDFDHVYPLVNRFPEHAAELELVEGMVVLEKNGRYGVAGRNQEVVVEILGSAYPILDSLELHCDARAYDFKYVSGTPYFLCSGEHGLSAKAFYADMDTQKIYTVFSGDDGPGSFYSLDGSRMKGELGLYHAISGYSKSQEGIPEYEWLNRVGVFNRQGELVTDAIYEDGLAVTGDLMPVARDGLWGYVNAAGEEIIPCQYRALLLVDPDHDRWTAYPPDHGRIVAQNQAGYYGVLGMDGAILVPFEYNYAAPFYDGQILLEKDGVRSFV